VLLQAPGVQLKGNDSELLRFCFRCTKLHPLNAFKGAERLVIAVAAAAAAAAG
jgi:hypothetical protein